MAKTPSEEERAALTAQRKEAQAREGEVAMAEYQAAIRAEREKTIKLREMRLAKEKRDAAAAEKQAEKAAAKAALKAAAEALRPQFAPKTAAKVAPKPGPFGKIGRTAPQFAAAKLPAGKALPPKAAAKPAAKPGKPASKPAAKPKAAKGKKKKQ